MNTPLVAPTNISFTTPTTNVDSKIKSVINTTVEIFSIITMWGVVATFIGLLGLTWVY
jgi:hypothetical protein